MRRKNRKEFAHPLLVNTIAPVHVMFLDQFEYVGI
jgi:hypothetical protein